MRYFELLEFGPATNNANNDLSMTGSAALAGVGRYTAQDDQINKANFGDTRKPKITLKMLNRLKMMRAAKKLEILQKTKILGTMYGIPLADEESM